MKERGKKQRFLKVVISGFLAFVVVVTMLPLGVFAEEGASGEAISETSGSQSNDSSETQKTPDESGSKGSDSGSKESSGEADKEAPAESAKPESSDESKTGASEAESKDESSENSSKPETSGSEATSSDGESSEDSEKPESSKEEDKEKEEENKRTYSEELSIATAEELISFARKVNSGDAMKDTLVKLVNDINLEKKEWTPIGDKIANPFSGKFDGQGYKISGLVVSDDVYGGLFGFLVDAELTGVNINQPVARLSTGGLFYVALRTNIELSSYKVGLRSLSFSVAAFSANVPKWDGLANTSWASDGYYIIRSGGDLKQFADMVNGGNTFEGETVILANSIDLNGHSWSPIGKTYDVLSDTGTPFRGKFLGGNNTIYGLNITEENDNIGLFACIKQGSVSNLTISGARLDVGRVTTAMNVGILVGNIDGTTVDNITVIDSEILSQDTLYVGGVIGGASDTNFHGQDAFDNFSTINNIKFINSKIKVEGSAWLIGGIISFVGIPNVSKCMVVGSELSVTNGDETGLGGIAGNAMETIAMELSTISNNLVFDVTFNTTNDSIVGGIVGKSDLTVLRNNIVSDIKINGSYGEANVGSCEGGGFSTFEYNMTDVTSLDKFFPESDFVSNSFWDNAKNITSPTHGSKNNIGNETTAMVNGAWTPLAEEWVAVKNQYPQLRNFTYDGDEFSRKISALASTAVISANEDEHFAESGARNLTVYKTAYGVDASGNQIPYTINWSITPSDTDSFIKEESDEKIVIRSKANNPVEITASIDINGRTYTKTFANVMLVDGFLEEDIAKRPGHNEPSLTLEANSKIKIYYLEDIQLNPEVLDMAVLQQKSQNEAGETVYVPRRYVPIDGSAPVDQFSINSTEKSFEIGFSPIPLGGEFRIVIPSGAVKEVSGINDGNWSEEIVIDFNTLAVGAPVIQLSKNSISRYSDDKIKLEDFTKNIKVMASNDPGDEVIFDGTGSSNKGSISKYKGEWTAKDPWGSMDKALESSSFPDGKSKVMYYLESESEIIGSGSSKTGTYNFFIMAKNKHGRVAKSAMAISIVGVPEWSGELSTHVHLPWTSDAKAIATAAKQKQTVVTILDDGTRIPSPVVTEIDELALAGVKDTDGDPAHINVTFKVLDSTGNFVPDLERTICVYLDKHLTWKITPSPVNSAYSTERQIEEMIGFVPLNFKSTDIKYEHWENDYRKPGKYYVDVESEPQYVTDCPNKNCKYPGKHPEAEVNDTFIVNVHEPLGPEIDSFWGQASAKLESKVEENIYSQKVVELEPKSYVMPSYVINSLAKQNYGQLQTTFHGEYRWNFYSSTLDNSYRWNDYYSLKVNGVNEPSISKLAGGYEKAVFLRFENQGKLFGEVEFEINLDKARAEHSGLPSKNLGLYRYNEQKHELELVSNIIAKENSKWASAVLKETLPTVYVLKAKQADDKIHTETIPVIRTEKSNYQTTDIYERVGNLLLKRDGDNILVSQDGEKLFLSSIEVDNYVPVTEKTQHNIKIALLIVAVVTVIGVVGFAVYRKVLGKGRKENEEI